MTASPSEEHGAAGEQAERDVAEQPRRLERLLDELEGDGADQHAGPEGHHEPQHEPLHPKRSATTPPIRSDELANSPQANASTIYGEGAARAAVSGTGPRIDGRPARRS